MNSPFRTTYGYVVMGNSKQTSLCFFFSFHLKFIAMKMHKPGFSEDGPSGHERKLRSCLGYVKEQEEILEHIRWGSPSKAAPRARQLCLLLGREGQRGRMRCPPLPPSLYEYTEF